MDRDDRGKTGEPGEESFPEMLERTYSEPPRLEPGEKVSARIIGITSEHIFLDLGRKGEGCIEKKEFHDADGNLTVREGDTIQAYFVGTRDNEMLFATRIGGAAVDRTQMEDAWRNGIPVEGTVEKEVKGGFAVRIAGGFRGFCPYSHMGNASTESREDPVGKRFLFRITKYDGSGRNIVLSHRVLLEEKRREERESLRETLREGMTVKGTITSVREFGAFVSVGPIRGLVPASEAGWDRGKDIRETLSPGQEIEVAIIRLDWEKERFRFSLKETLPDPWDRVGGKYPAGSRHAGTVSRLTAFGAFVSLEPGVDGLLHISKLGGGSRIRHPGEAVKVGEEVAVQVESMDREKRRISLSLQDDGGGKGDASDSEEYRQYLREKAPPPVGSLGEALQAKLKEKGRR